MALDEALLDAADGLAALLAASRAVRTSAATARASVVTFAPGSFDTELDIGGQTYARLNTVAVGDINAPAYIAPAALPNRASVPPAVASPNRPSARNRSAVRNRPIPTAIRIL
jgi:hypothetical protein